MLISQVEEADGAALPKRARCAELAAADPLASSAVCIALVGGAGAMAFWPKIVEAGLDDKGSPRSSTSSRRNWLLPVLGGLLCAAYVYSQFAGVAATDPAKPARPQEPFDVILAKAGRRALGGGLSGAAAGIAQVLLLMWLRTAMNYQYRHGQGS